MNAVWAPLVSLLFGISGVLDDSLRSPICIRNIYVKIQISLNVSVSTISPRAISGAMIDCVITECALQGG